MRILFTAALAMAAMGLTTPATAALTLVGTFDGNQCGGAGGFSACYASGTTAGTGAISKTPGGSPSIIRIENGGSTDISTAFPTVTGSEFTTSYVSGTNTLSFTYTAGAGDPVAHYLGIFQGGSAVGGNFNNTYDLFYDPNPITSGSINLSTYFQNPGWSHIDFFDTGAVPEPATWALMLVGFAGMGTALRRSRRRQGQLLQIA
jgi:hypothetical protein